MFDTVEVVRAAHPFARAQVSVVPAGLTIAQIVQRQGVAPHEVMATRVAVLRGGDLIVVPLDRWSRVRVKAGAGVEIVRVVEGRTLRTALLIAVSVFAPYVGGLAAGALGITGTLGISLVTAGVGLVGSLLVNALIPPPQPPTAPTSDPRYSITGNANAANPFGVVPSVLGRRRMYPVLTGRGYTEVVGDDIFYRFRAVWSYGTGHLDDLRVGETSIAEFTDIEIEFRGFDEVHTRAAIPALDDMDCVFLDDADHMRLYPSDIFEDHHSVNLEKDVPVVRSTAPDTIAVSIDLSYPKGRYFQTKSTGKVRPYQVDIRYEYRAAGSEEWTLAGVESNDELINTPFATSYPIEFDSPGEYEIRVTRLVKRESDDVNLNADSVLSVVRSIASEPLPNIPGVCEIALRIRATDQLSGSLQTVNGMFWRHAPVWDGTAWSDPQPVRHPAWVFALAARGDHLARPVPAARLDPADLLAWAQDEPHWTCDIRVDQSERLGAVLRAIAATGRARFTLRDLKYTIVRDGGAGPVVGHFTPRNLADFEISRTLRDPVHALRMRFTSEVTGDEDELTVYADGFDASNATNFETMQLRGVVLTDSDADGGNVWRLGRYHLAAFSLRRAQYTWKTDIESVRHHEGDKIIAAHDVAFWGLGSGRISAVVHTGRVVSEILLDEQFQLSAAIGGDVDGHSDAAYDAGALLYLNPADGKFSFDAGGAASARAEDRGAVLYLDPASGAPSFDVSAGAAVMGGRRLRLRVRRADGSELTFDVTHDAGEVARFYPVEGVDIADVGVGDLVMLEEVEIAPVDLLITRIERDGIDGATYTAVDAAPAVLLADQGAIPDYSPRTTPPRVLEAAGPPYPTFDAPNSSEATLLQVRGAPSQPRIGLHLQPSSAQGVAPSHHRLRWRVQGGVGAWMVGGAVPVSSRWLYSDPVVDGVTYDVQVEAIAANGASRGWVSTGNVTASAYDAPPPDVAQLLAQLDGFNLSLSWAAVVASDLRGYQVRYALDGATAWGAAERVAEVPAAQTAIVLPRRTGLWMVRAIDHSDQLSEGIATVTVAPDNMSHRVAYVAELVTTAGSSGSPAIFGGETEFAADAVQLKAAGGEYPAAAVWTGAASAFSHSEPSRMFLLDCEIDAYAVHADGGTPGGWSVEIGLVRGLITGVDDYMPITPGEEIEIADSAIAELILRSDDPLTTPVVRSAKWRILEVRRTETGSVTAPAGGYAEVYFDWPFGEVPQIQVTANDAAAVASVRVYEVTSGKRKAGFRVIAYDGAGAAIAADLSWTATGYGQRVNIPPSAGLPAPPPRYST